MSDGDWAIAASSRPSRVRCSKCWSTIVPSTSPSPAAVCTWPCRGVAPGWPNAIMCEASALAPAEVPRSPPRGRERGASPWCSRVPAIDRRQPQLIPAGEEDGRGLAQLRGRRSSVGLAALLRMQRRSRSRRRARGRGASYSESTCSPISDAVATTTMLASAPPARRANRLRMLLAPQLVLGAADQHDRARSTDDRGEVRTTAGVGHVRQSSPGSRREARRDAGEGAADCAMRDDRRDSWP